MSRSRALILIQTSALGDKLLPDTKVWSKMIFKAKRLKFQSNNLKEIKKSIIYTIYPRAFGFILFPFFINEIDWVMDHLVYFP